MSSVLVIDDEQHIRHLVSRSLDQFTVLEASRADEGLEIVRRQKPDVVLLDIRLPDMSGLDCFKKIHEIDNKLPVIFITASVSSELAIDAMQLGAYNYVMKPLNLPELREIVTEAASTRRMMSVAVSIPSTDPKEAKTGDMLVGQSPEMMRLYTQIGRVAGQNVTVLIRGEHGTGKELVARAIYQHSQRRDGPFLAVNCASLKDTLLESELFGHEKGAFTGADSRRIGKFEQCSGGTIFLDEIGDMAQSAQSKVLRLLQEQMFERVGGNETIKTDVRIIAATNRDLEEMVERKEYRGDLFFRINGYTINLPPLRNRGNDIEVLIQHFLARYTRELRKTDVEGFSEDAVKLLRAYPWPGNIRELEAVVKKVLVNTTGSVIVPSFLPDEVRHTRSIRDAGIDRSTSGPAPEPAAPLTTVTEAEQPVAEAEEDSGAPYNLKTFIDQELTPDAERLHERTIDLTERYLLTRVLSLTGGNQSQAAKILGITRGSLRSKIRSLNISIEQVVSVDP